MKNLDYYVGMATEAIKNDKDRDLMYAEIDKHRLGQWKPNQALSRLPWIAGHNFSSTSPADTLDAGSRTFATMMPKIAISPLFDNPAEYDRVERHETVLDWHFKRMNMWGKKTTHWKIMESAMRYCSVAFETEYLPYLMKGKKDKRVKALLKNSAFRWTVHHPSTVHSFHSKYGLECVVLAKVMTLKELMDDFGKESKGIQEVLEKHVMKKDNLTATDLMQTFTLYKCTDWDYVCMWVTPNNGSMNANPNATKGVELMHKEHGLNFIPWVIADNEDPILKNAINTGLLDNLNNLRLLSYSAAVSMVAASQQWIRTPDGTLTGVHIDNENPMQPIVTDSNTQITPINQMRPNDSVEQKVQQAQQEVYTTTVAQILADANKLAGNENFSTANMAYKVAIGSLSLARDAAARAEAMGFYQMYEWIEHANDIPLIAYREKSKSIGNEERMAGEELYIAKGEFDLEHLYIDVKLREFGNMDEQAKWNLAITQVERMGMSRQLIAEELGVENYMLHEQKRAAEDMTTAKVQLEIQKEQLKVDMEARAAQLKMEMEARAATEPPPNPENAAPGMNASYPMAEGADMRGGGLPAQPMNPAETQVSLQGQDANGVSV